MRIGSLFSGIGGLELGLESAGLGEVVWQCELDPFCRRVLAKHWPNVEKHDDVRTFHPKPVDVLCGGFPCQDVSSGNTRGAKGLDGERSGLWREFRRIAEAITPSIIVVENVASGARRWLPFVRRDLHVLGYRTRAYALSADDVGANQRRRRVFVIAYAHAQGEHAEPIDAQVGSSQTRTAETPSDPKRIDVRQQPGGSRGPRRPNPQEPSWAGGGFAEPPMVRTLHGLPEVLDRPERKRRRELRTRDRQRERALGNSVVPQCAYVIGRIIAEGAYLA
jgi:DNA (cytosine-5)-methyltransferase 1